MMNIKSLVAVALGALTLVACRPNLKTIGTVDDDKLITPKTLADMGYEAFREKYLGEEVTLTDFHHAILDGTYKEDKAQCEVAFATKDEESGKKFHIYIPTIFQILL